MKYVSFLFFVASLGLLSAVADAAQIDKMYTSNGTPYIFINGEIVSGDAKRFHVALTEDMTGHSPKIVRLNSPGGEVYEGWELAQEMVKYHMSSIVTHDDVCASSCFSIFLVGKHRYSQPRSRIGVHRVSVGYTGQETRITSTVSQDMADFYKKFQVPESVRSWMYYTKPTDIHFLTMDEKYGMGQVLSDSMGAQTAIDQAVGTYGKTPKWKRKIYSQCVELSDEDKMRGNSAYADRVISVCNDEVRAGNAAAMTELGSMYFYGLGVYKDLNTAWELFNKGYALGDPEASGWLGYLYQNGIIVQRDYKKAFELFEDLADDGHPDAQNNLAVMYMNGQGTDVDYEEAAELLQKSADQGVTAAMFHLGLLYLYGKGVDQDLDKAGSLLTEACDRNLNVACEKLELFQ